MKSLPDKDSRASRAMRYGGYATLLVAVVVAITVAVNVLAGLLPVRIDLSAERFYSLSAQTESVLDALAAPVEITGLFEAGRENVLVDELLKKYASRSRRITLAYRDPYRDPGLVERYSVGGEPPGIGSYVVECGDKFKVVRSADLYEWSTSSAGGQAAAGQIQDFVAEQVFTSAIVHVTSKRDPVVYLLRGHDEPGLPEQLAALLGRTSYALNELNLATAAEVPEDATVLVILSPRSDLSPSEAERVRRYLQERGGRALVTMDLGTQPFPNLLGVLATYGVSVEPMLVVETAADYYVTGEPLALIPNIADHPITASLREGDVPVIIPYSQVVAPREPRRRTLTLEPLLASTDRSWAQRAWQDAGSGSRQRGPDDPSGPFGLAIAVTDRGEEGQAESRIVVFGSTTFLYPPSSIGRLQQNENLVANSLSWLSGSREIIPIRPRSISGIRYQLNLTAAQFYLFAGLSIIVIPAAVLALGLVLWLRRRHL